MQNTVNQGQAWQTGYGTKPYRSFVLLSLTLVYTLNFIDRVLISVVAQPIINTFNLSDFLWGLMSGWPFATFYAFMGIPIAMLADRTNRVRIIVICIILWSLMTALCGLAVSIGALILFRIGVAIGEAGCTPTANSIIGDYYPQRARVGALAIYSLGVTLGGLLAQLFGGSIAQLTGQQFGAFLESISLDSLFDFVDWSNVEGWRLAFILIGLPGVLVGLIILFTVKEPPRGYSDPPDTTPTKKAGILDTFKILTHKPAFWWMTLGGSCAALVGYGLMSFQAPFVMRVHGVDVAEAGIRFGVPLTMFAALGTFLGGKLIEMGTPRFPTIIGWLPALAFLIAIPFNVTAFLVPSATICLALWCVANVFQYAYIGAQFSVAQGVVPPASRATSVAIFMVAASLVGSGVGPPIVGLLSGFFMDGQMAAAGLPADFSIDLCKARDLSALSGFEQSACKAAYGGGLRFSMVAVSFFFLLSALGFYMAGRHLKRDMVANQG